jgi:hypothetical protein
MTGIFTVEIIEESIRSYTMNAGWLWSVRPPFFIHFSGPLLLKIKVLRRQEQNQIHCKIAFSVMFVLYVLQMLIPLKFQAWQVSHEITTCYEWTAWIYSINTRLIRIIMKVDDALQIISPELKSCQYYSYSFFLLLIIQY